MTNKEILKKQIIYRSSHRGIKEMDLLLGDFVKKNIDSLNDSDLIDLKNLVKIEDKVLQRWYFEKNDNNLVPCSKVSQMFKKFKL